MAHGAKGYEWLIQNNEYTLKIGNWMEVNQKPNVMVEIRSETLWSHGHFESVNRVFEFLVQQGAIILIVKPSRVDLCVDMLVNEDLWTTELINYSVTRSTYTASHLTDNRLTGLTIGKGNVVARLYDKPLEIKQKKKRNGCMKFGELSQFPMVKKLFVLNFNSGGKRLTIYAFIIYSIF